MLHRWDIVYWIKWHRSEKARKEKKMSDRVGETQRRKINCDRRRTRCNVTNGSLHYQFVFPFHSLNCCIHSLHSRPKRASKISIRFLVQSSEIYHEKWCFTKHVESLFEKCMFEKEAWRITICLTVIGITRFVQCFAKNFATEMNAATDENSRDFSKFNIGQTVSTESFKRKREERRFGASEDSAMWKMFFADSTNRMFLDNRRQCNRCSIEAAEAENCSATLSNQLNLLMLSCWRCCHEDSCHFQWNMNDFALKFESMRWDERIRLRVEDALARWNFRARLIFYCVNNREWNGKDFRLGRWKFGSNCREKNFRINSSKKWSPTKNRVQLAEEFEVLSCRTHHQRLVR